jgi:hypothetical protein
MKRVRIIVVFALWAAILTAFTSSATQLAQQDKTGVVLWKNPGNISARDLYYGPGSKSLAPAPPFQFIEEDKKGASPKFKVKDARNIEWSVKLGIEAQAEVVATRLVWAVGYFAEETYYFPRVRINNLPRLSRGQEYVENGDTARGVRFEARRPGAKRGEYWSWSNNPFVGTRELDGLKALMILLNNHDARKANNRVILVTNQQNHRVETRYVVTDLGATLGRAGGYGEKRSENNLADFLSTGFVRGVEDGEVKFDYNARPTGLGFVAIFYPPYFIEQWKEHRDMKGIRVEHAQWIGSHLARLTNAQLHEAFRAADYDAATTKGYVQAFSERIKQLSQLRGATPQLIETSRGSE